MGVQHMEACCGRIEGNRSVAGDEGMARAGARVDEHLAGRVREVERLFVLVAVPARAGAIPVAEVPAGGAGMSGAGLPPGEEKAAPGPGSAPRADPSAIEGQGWMDQMTPRAPSR